MIRRVLALSLVSLAFVAPADADANDARRKAIVAHVGAATIAVSDLEDHMAQVPPFQLATFGETPSLRARKFLNDVMIPEMLLSLAAKDRHLEKTLPTSYELDRVRSDAAIRSIKNGVTPAARISIEDVKKFYDDNKIRYDTPERVNVWRILCLSRNEATSVLASAKKDPTLTNWNALAREHSIDKATSMRGGNLGFLSADGTSNEAGLRADAAIPAAASHVKDGEFVSEPIAEGASFAVIWRRGTVAANHRPLAEVESQIRDTIFKERGDAEAKRVTDVLRARDLKEFNPGLLDTIDVTLGAGQVVPRKRPGQVSPSASAP